MEGRQVENVCEQTRISLVTKKGMQPRTSRKAKLRNTLYSEAEAVSYTTGITVHCLEQQDD